MMQGVLVNLNPELQWQKQQIELKFMEVTIKVLRLDYSIVRC